MTSQHKTILLFLALFGIGFYNWYHENPEGFKAVMHQIAVMLALTCDVDCGH